MVSWFLYRVADFRPAHVQSRSSTKAPNLSNVPTSSIRKIQLSKGLLEHDLERAAEVRKMKESCTSSHSLYREIATIVLVLQRSSSLNPLKGGSIGKYHRGLTIRVIKGDTRSLDYGSNGARFFP